MEVEQSPLLGQTTEKISLLLLPVPLLGSSHVSPKALHREVEGL